MDSADSCSVSDSNLYISSESPVRSPGVLDLVECVSDIISHSKYSVVQAGGTQALDGSALVKLPLDIGINSHRHGLLRDSSLECDGAVGSDLSVRGDSGGSLGGSGAVAGLVDGLVGVVDLSGDSVVLHVVEAVVHPASVAALVAVAPGAVHQLLFGQRGQCVACEEPGALDGAHGREGPATAAGALVLHWSHGVLQGPVHGVRDAHVLEVSGRTHGARGHQARHPGLEFLGGHVGEGVGA